MTLTFWGVRGGIPVPGVSTAKTGGNTVCIDIADDDGTRTVMDAGTGIIMLGKKLLAGPCGKGQGEVHIVLTHTYWDHIQGFPYFIPAFIPGNKILFWGRSVSERSLYELLDWQMKAEYNPIFALKNMGSQIAVREIGNEMVKLGRLTMTTTILPHRGKASLGYRITDGNRTVVLMGDLHVESSPHAAMVRFVEGADLLIHDIGESTHVQGEHGAVRLAKQARVKRLALTHYAPEFTDEDVAALLATIKEGAGDAVAVEGATEGLQIAL